METAPRVVFSLIPNVPQIEMNSQIRSLFPFVFWNMSGLLNIRCRQSTSYTGNVFRWIESHHNAGETCKCYRHNRKACVYCLWYSFSIRNGLPRASRSLQEMACPQPAGWRWGVRNQTVWVANSPVGQFLGMASDSTATKYLSIPFVTVLITDTKVRTLVIKSNLHLSSLTQVSNFVRWAMSIQ